METAAEINWKESCLKWVSSPTGLSILYFLRGVIHKHIFPLSDTLDLGIDDDQHDYDSVASDEDTDSELTTQNNNNTQRSNRAKVWYWTPSIISVKIYRKNLLMHICGHSDMLLNNWAPSLSLTVVSQNNRGVVASASRALPFFPLNDCLSQHALREWLQSALPHSSWVTSSAILGSCQRGIVHTERERERECV